jgi:hypothetical protein
MASLVLNVTTSAASVNLTSLAADDWAKWEDGDFSGTPSERKSGGGSTIGAAVIFGGGSFLGYNADPRTISWTDGTPTGSGSNQEIIYNGTYAVNRGFTVSFPADTTPREARIYLGAYSAAQTRITAILSDGSVGNQVDTSFSTANGAEGDCFAVVTYEAGSAGQTMTLRVEIVLSNTGDGSMSLAAATVKVTSVPPVAVNESSAGTDAQNRTMALGTAGAETSAGTDAQNRTLALDRAAAETSAGTEAQNRTLAVPAAGAESSAGTTAQDRTMAASGAVSESSAGTDAQDRTLALAGAVSEASAGTTTQDWAAGAANDVNESSTSSTLETRTVAFTRDQTETSAGTTDQDRVFAPPGTRDVAESSGSATAQDRVVTPPPTPGNGASGYRRWLVQYYTDYFEKREKEKALKEMAENIEQLSAGAVKVTEVKRIAKLPEPIVQLTPDAKLLEANRIRRARQRALEEELRVFQENQQLLLEAAAAIASTREIANQRLTEQDDEDDLLLLASVL